MHRKIIDIGWWFLLSVHGCLFLITLTIDNIFDVDRLATVFLIGLVIVQNKQIKKLEAEV